MKQEIWIRIKKDDPYIIIYVIIQEIVIKIVTFSDKIIGPRRISWYYRILHGTIASAKIISYNGSKIKSDGSLLFKKYLISEEKVQVLLNISNFYV